MASVRRGDRAGADDGESGNADLAAHVAALRRTVRRTQSRLQDTAAALRSSLAARPAATDADCTAAEENTDLAHLWSAVEAGAVFVDGRLAIRRFTAATAALVALTKHDVGRPIAECASEFGEDFVRDVDRALALGQPVERECRSTRGSWLRRRVSPYVTAAGTVDGVVATFVDITPIRNAREMARVVTEELAHAQRELSTQRADLEDMMSIVVHDLKRPVLALDGLLTLARRGGAADAGLLRRGQVECGRLKRMLLDLEALAGLRRREIVFEEVELAEWLYGVADHHRAGATERGARLDVVVEPGRWRVPRVALEDALASLIENALQYGCTALQPVVTLTGGTVDGCLEVAVSDNGRGVAPEHRRRVFEPFRRLDRESGEGSGMGLVMARRIVGQCGGTLALDAGLDVGARFVVRVPLGARDAQRPADTPRPRILLVEDDLLDAKLVARWLRPLVHITRVAAIGDAEVRLRDERFDLVLLDLSLPDGHGLELVQRVRTGPGCHVPIVVITGHGDGLVPAAMSASIDGYLAKGDLTQDGLQRVVQEALRGKVPRRGA